MAENPGSKDKALEALDFIINVLKEHEQSLDKSIAELAAVTEQIRDTTDALNGKVIEIEEKTDNLQKEVANLMGKVLNEPIKALPTATKEHEPQAQARPASSPAAAVQGGPFVILRCKQWEDFQALAMHVPTLSFSHKEGEKSLQVDALRGNQIIRYVGALPSFPKILKAWLSQELEIAEHNILEGFIDKSK